MNRVLFDTNVLLDVLLHREEFLPASVGALSLVDGKAVLGYMAAHAVPTIHYLLERAYGRKVALARIADLCAWLRVATVDDKVIRQALALRFPDFEAAITNAAAEATGCRLLVTRNPKDFAKSSLNILLPEAFLVLAKSE